MLNVTARNAFTGAPETFRIHDVHLDLFVVDRSLANTSEAKGHKSAVIILNKYENDRVQLLKKENGYSGAFVYCIDKVVGYQQDHVRPNEIAELQPPSSQADKEAIVSAKRMILVGQVQDQDSFGSAPVNQCSTRRG